MQPEAEARLPAEAPAARRAFAPGVVAAIVCAVAFIAMALVTWQTWSEPLSDFGRELYVPWQLGEGKVLYRDVLYFNGPVSPWINALVMRLFGPSFRAIILANLLIHAVALVLLWNILRRVSDALITTAAVLAVILTVSFGSLMPGGNLNHVAPYSHEMTHGFLLQLAGVWGMIMLLGSDHPPRRQAVLAALAGAAAGLLALLKIELFLAAFAAQIFLLAMSLRGARAGRARVAGAFLAGLIAPPIVAVAILSLWMPVGTALRGAFGSFVYTFTTDVSQEPFYRWMTGLDRPRENLFASAKYALFILVIVGGLVATAGAVGWLSRRSASLARRLEQAGSFPLRPVASAAIMLVAGAALYVVVPRRIWVFLPQAMNLLILLLGIALAVALLRGWRDADRRREGAMRLALVLFAGLMLAKMALRPGLAHVGFVLGMPAFVMLIVAGAAWLPSALDRARLPGWIVRGGVLGLVAIIVIAHLQLTLGHNRQKTARLQIGGASLRVYEPVARDFRTLASAVESLGPEATVVMLPEGAMLNFATGRENPAGLIVAMPAEIAMFGEAALLERLEAHPPTMIITSAETLGSHGVEHIADYMPRIASWIESNYEPRPITAPLSPTIRVHSAGSPAAPLAALESAAAAARGRGGVGPRPNHTPDGGP